ncbi:MAG TPA: helix-turn-helix domain-containing protein [Smithella sp.]|nr:helix-turn-helix domain-containing protein [Smithella sp.]HRS98105.1 helix-turn-helix domain-containing protein [Smithella sp.]
MPKIVNHAEYRRELLEKAFNLFTLKGYNNVNMREIASEIGVSTGTLYHYFSSKEKMLAEMILWIGTQNTEEYVQRTLGIDSLKDRFDMIVNFWREKGELYEKILLLGFDMYRNTPIEQWKAIYEAFAERYIVGMSERLNISRQLARFIFIYFLGLSFHGIASDSMEAYNREIDFLDTLLRPIVVDAHQNLDRASQKIKNIYKKHLINEDVRETSKRFREVFRSIFADVPTDEEKKTRKVQGRDRAQKKQNKKDASRIHPKTITGRRRNHE